MRETGKCIRLLLLTFFTTALVSLLWSGRATAQDHPPVQNVPSQFTQQTMVPIQLPNYNDPANPTGGDILIDNFEYWDDAKNHGWISCEPDYPVWGYGIGYGQILTVMDFQEGSRVLDVYRPVSAFLPFTEPPLSNPLADRLRYMPYTIIRPLNINFGTSGPHSLLSFKVRAPLSVEQFDTFRVIVDVTTSLGGFARIVFIPRERSVGCTLTSVDSVIPKNANCSTIAANSDVIEVYLGREFQDSTWHLVNQNLDDILAAYVGTAPAESITGITQIMVRGNQYRLDDITFSQTRPDGLGSAQGIGCPYLYKIGPLFVQLFAPTQRLVFAEDHMGNIYDILNNPDDITIAYAQDSRDGFAPESIYWLDKNAGTTHVAEPDPLNWTDAEIQAAKARVTAAGLNPASPVLADQTMRRRNLGNLNHEEDMLQFRAFIGGGSGSGAFTQTLIRPLEIVPGSGKPAYLPAYYHFGKEEPHMAPHGHCIGTCHESEGMYYFSPARVALIEQALLNAGYRFWPNVAVLEFQPQVLEDLIVTVEVSNGLSRDIETFPVSVVNYPVDNFPPIMEDLDNQIAYVGETFYYPITANDPDTCIYTGTGTHPKADQFGLTWSATIADLPAYMYGPWAESLINPRSGEIMFTPQFEGVYAIVVRVDDPRGFFTVNQFEVYCVNPGTWLNHPPVVLGDWDHPQVCRAGELFVLDSEIDVTDPDGDRVYLSCNIGSIGTDSNGNVIWSFQTQFPGFYVVEIFALDGRGGFTTFTIDLEVRPWWAI